MRVVVTGGCGKAGSFVVKELLRGGHDVAVLDRAKGELPAGVAMVEGDILDREIVGRALSGADAVLHLAGIPRPGLVPDAVLFQTNVVGAYNVYDAAMRSEVRRVVLTSSTSVLGWDWGGESRLPCYLPLDEKHPCTPEDAYGLSKVACEAIAAAFRRRCGMETPVLRPPWIATPNELQTLRSDGGRQPDRFRHYAYVDARDLAVAFRLAVERPGLTDETMFVAADDSVLLDPMKVVLPRLSMRLASLAVAVDGNRPNLSNACAKRILGWQPARGWR